MAVLTGVNKEGFITGFGGGIDKDHGFISTETIMEKLSVDPTTYIDGNHGLD